MYLGWANSLLCEQGILIDGLHQLRDGTVFCQLIELLTGTQLIPKEQVSHWQAAGLSKSRAKSATKVRFVKTQGTQSASWVLMARQIVS